MAKVIQLDNLGRDYKPEKLITTAIPEALATKIAEVLNDTGFGTNTYYRVVPNNYELDLSSMYDVTEDPRPVNFEFVQYGLDAIPRRLLSVDRELE